jgi:NAD(P)-dependent dehydrogenase (short-subunit alcohol dehydrogenase family)
VTARATGALLAVLLDHPLPPGLRAIAFAAEGAHVVVSGRSEGRGAEVIKEITACGGRAGFIAADLDGSADASRALAAAATRALGGRLDILVNNAGIYPGDTTPAGRPGSPDAIAHAAVYLASDEATFVHGTVIDVDGGRVGVAVLTP